MGLLDAIGRGFETWGAGAIAQEAGPDWREQMAERSAARRRAAAQEERAAAGAGRAEAAEKVALQDKLAASIAEMMEAEQEPGSAGQIDLGGYKANLPVSGPPNYETSLPSELVERSGTSADSLVRRARGKRMLSRRQLALLNESNRLSRDAMTRQFRTSEREAGQEFRSGQTDKTLGVRRSEGAANRSLRRELHDDTGADALQSRHAGSVKATLDAIRQETRQLERDAAKDPTVKFDPVERQRMEQEILDRAGMVEDVTTGRLMPGNSRPAPDADLSAAPAPRPASRAAGPVDVSTPDDVRGLPDGSTFRLRGRTFRKQGDRYFEVR